MSAERIGARRPVRWSLLIAAALVLAPRVAAAEWVLTPFIGGHVGGAATINAGAARDNTQNSFGRSLVYGVSVGRSVTRALSVEADIARSPHAFATSRPANAFQFSRESGLTTVMGNVIFSDPDGAVRPFVLGGLGVLRTDLHPLRNVSPRAASDVGLDVGGGAIAALTPRVALRGDVRYFRSFRSTEYRGLALAELRFWRLASGVSFSF